ncbi:hypothetical protein [Streptomyces sp. NBC_00094]|uniref:hypothetical protein n=1 Tax=Streptomyces sp. NBC_00094 TaxID=2903620 RepID=UPI00225A62D4|nr:hypothetical protein [Streptomyces sp. NBC_00094]MCX5392634.1 hypothetical protein [Streptomyces sp. NBC_00094]
MERAGGERSVTVDNGSGVVVIGDGNRIGVPEPMAVRSGYREQVRRIAPTELVDREVELAELAAFCLTGSRPAYVWWRAEAWAGKTALLSWFALDPPPGVRIVPFFVTARLGAQNDVTAFVDVVLEQLAELAGEGLPALLTAATREAHLLRLYATAAASCAARGERLVLLVDGLDEDRGVTTGPDAHSIAALLPYDLPVIVSGRLNPPLPVDVPEDHPLRAPEAVRLLAPSPKARAIRAEAERELKRLLEAGGLPYDLLALLTAAGGGLTADDLAELTDDVPYRVKDVLRTGPGRTFAVRGDAYLLAHEELRLQAGEMLGTRELGRYRSAVHSWAEGWRARGWPEDTPDYLLHGWFSELRAAGDPERMTRCALDEDRHDRLLARTGGDLAALTEIEETETAVIDAGVPDFLDFLRLVVARERLEGRSDGIPPTLPWAWAVLGRYGRAEGLARSIRSLDWRAQALTDIALRLFETGETDEAVALLAEAQDAAAQAGNMTGDEREKALAVVCRAWSRIGLLDRAAAVALLVEHPRTRSELLCELSRAWSAAGMRERAVALCRVEPDAPTRARVLAETAVGYAECGDVEQAVRLAAEAGPDGEVLPLVRIAGVLLRGGDGRAAAILDRVDAMIRVSPVLAATVGALAEAGEFERAIAAVRLLDKPESRAWALRDVVGAFVAAGRRDRAQALAETIEAPEARGSALREVVAGLAATDDLGTAEELAWSIDDEWARERALRVVVNALVAAGALDRAEALARRGDPWRTLSRHLLAAVVEALAVSGDLRRAHELASDVPYGEGGLALVRGVVTACSEGAGPEALAAAAGLVAEVEDRIRAESRGTAADPFHAARALAEAGFADLARGLLRGVEDGPEPVGDAAEGGAAPIGWQIRAGSAAEALVRMGEFARAEALMRRLTAVPSAFLAAVELVRRLCGEGLFEDAEAVGERLDGQVGEHLWLVLAEGAAEHGEVAKAESYARRVTRADDRVRAWAAIAVAYARAGDGERADVCLDEALSHFEQGLLVFMAVPGLVRALFELGEEEAGDKLLAEAAGGAGYGARWISSGHVSEIVRALVAGGEYDRARAFVRSLPDSGDTLHVWIALVTALAEAGEHARAAAEVRVRGLPGESEESGDMPFGWGRLVRVVEPGRGRLLLARLLRKHSLEDLLPDVLSLEPAAAPFVFEVCARGSATSP